MVVSRIMKATIKVMASLMIVIILQCTIVIFRSLELSMSAIIEIARDAFALLPKPIARCSTDALLFWFAAYGIACHVVS